MRTTIKNINVIKHLAAKSVKFRRHNNILVQELNSESKFFKKLANKAEKDSFSQRNFIEDTGFDLVDNGKFIVRKRIVQKAVDKVGNKIVYAKKMLSSVFEKEGRLLSREIQKVHDGFLTTERSIKVNYIPEKTNIMTVKMQNLESNITKIIEKGKSTKIITETPAKSNAEGLIKTITQRENFAHLNNSSIRYTEAISNEYVKNSENLLVPTKKLVVLKDGTKIIKNKHCDSPLFTEINNQGQVTIHRKPEEIKELLGKLDKTIQAFFE